MADSAILKVDRAAKHVADLIELFGKNRPFSYCVETNTQTGQRATFAKKNEPVINAAALICGDVVHNLRTALDHAYWDIVSPHAYNDAERRSVQFPFSETGTRLSNAIQQRLAHRAGMGFYRALHLIKPHGETGGDELLYFIHEADLVDKHRLLIPTGNYTRLSGDIIRRQVLDFPLIDVAFGGFYRDVTWTNSNVPSKQLGTLRPSTTNMFEHELDVPVDIVFRVRPGGPVRPVIATLNELINTNREAISLVREAALSC